MKIFDLCSSDFTDRTRVLTIADTGRNFETKKYEDAITEASFARLKKGVLAFINKTHFERITMILRSAGFVTSDLIGGRNAVNFAYILYLRGRVDGVPVNGHQELTHFGHQELTHP